MYPLEKCKKTFALSNKEERYDVSLIIVYSQVIETWDIDYLKEIVDNKILY